MKDNNGNDTEITLSARKTKDGKIVIRPSPNGDSRTKNEYCTREMVQEDILEHIKNVQLGMNTLSAKVANAGLLHDNTKITEQETYIDLVMNDVKDDEFLAGDWWINHIHKERHHLTANCPVDVNLVDVLEMVVDCVMADKGRKGYIDTKTLELSNDVLNRAYWNTIKMMDDMVVVR